MRRKNTIGRVDGAEMIRVERERQIHTKKFTAKRDAGYRSFQLTKAALSYASAVATPDEWAEDHGTLPAPTCDWPWPKKWWKPSSDPIRNLVKAGALIAAEIDRLRATKEAA